MNTLTNTIFCSNPFFYHISFKFIITITMIIIGSKATIIPQKPKCLLNHNNYYIMGFTKRNIILPLVFILVIISLLRVLKLTIISSSFTSSRFSHAPILPITTTERRLPKKEIQFLSDIIRRKSPCNVLVFGFEHEYLKLPIINKGGTTFFLENDLENVKTMKREFKSCNATRVIKVEYKTYARDTYALLKQARSSASCNMNQWARNAMWSECKLALTGLPEEALKIKWDVIVVDGPYGDGPMSSGRMGSIFMASVLARGRNGTNVVVHDVHRMIEKWFSWEFLCDTNRVSSKGRFWNFLIPNVMFRNNFAHFCSA